MANDLRSQFLADDGIRTRKVTIKSMGDMEVLVRGLDTKTYLSLLDDDGRFDRGAATAVAAFSIDAALTFAGEVWGIQGQRVAAANPSAPVRPIVEDAVGIQTEEVDHAV